MLTIEKFYFTHQEAADHIVMGGDAIDCQMTFVGPEDAPVSLRITMRGREEFRKLIQQIYDMGMGLVDGPSEDKEPSVGGLTERPTP